MGFSETWKGARDWTSKNKIMIVIPSILNMIDYLCFIIIFKEILILNNPITILFGFPGTYPRFRFLTQRSDSILEGILIYRLKYIALFIIITLLIGVIESIYLNMLSQEKVKLSHIYKLDFRLYNKVFVKKIIFIMFTLGFHGNVYKNLIAFILCIPFIFLSYSFLDRDRSFLQGVRDSVTFIIDNLGVTIKLVLYVGFKFSIIRIIIAMILGYCGGYSIVVLITIVVFSYVGVVANKFILSIYNQHKLRYIRLEDKNYI